MDQTARDRFVRNPVAAIWVAGAILAVLLYLTGPEHFVAAILDSLSWASVTIQRIAETLVIQAFDAIRAAAVALFVVFVVLAVIAIRRGLRARGALLTVSVLYLFLMWPATDGGWVSSDRWFAAFILAGVGAAIMTRRLAHPPLPVTRPANGPAGVWGQ